MIEILAFIFLAVIIIVLISANQKKDQKIEELSKRLLDEEQVNNQLQVVNKSHLEKIERYKKYDGIINADEQSLEILNEANTKAEKIIREANETLDSAKRNAKEINTAAKERLQNDIAKATLILQDAEEKATTILNDANLKAIEVAGDAYQAFINAGNLEKTIIAMKNVIEGYGNKYVIPTYTILDDLASNFSHTEAGATLRKIRTKVRELAENGQGAVCDYVEHQRRVTAVRFILDAFNGKVDSIIMKVKTDNYGTLEQMIKDAYQIVNSNGQAFKNAKITDTYLKLRLEELKWAVVTQELKWQEQEEQRRIKEQIREEEKAKRDFEKAIKEAQKEEEMLRKLIEKAHQEVNKANADQKALLERQLAELEQRLQTAEEKNQRAISMAQQTKTGNVYIISNIGSFGEDVFKIGMTRRLEPLDRIKELGDASVPFEFDVHAMIFSDDAPALERQLHKLFLKMQINKVNPRKEFFRLQLSDIKTEIESLGLSPRWTMTAAAKQYRETLVLEEAMKRDFELQKKWLAEQEKYELLTTVESNEELEAS